MGKITDQQFEAIKERLNCAVHELVFAIKHAEDDELDSACDCLVTVAGTVEEVAKELNNVVDGRA